MSLSLAGYEVLRERGSAILADGHVLAPSRAVRQRARELLDESIALLRQAQHQIDRAARARDTTSRRFGLVCGSCAYSVAGERRLERCPICGAWDWHEMRVL